jgi:hypothetical protein
MPPTIREARRMRLNETLKRLRASLSRKADDAYTDRDKATTPCEAKYAEGEGHAYGVAEDEIRQAQEDNE